MLAAIHIWPSFTLTQQAGSAELVAGAAADEDEAHVADAMAAKPRTPATFDILVTSDYTV